MNHRVGAGVYRARAVKGSEQYTRTGSGNEQIVIELDLLDLGERVSTYLVFTEKSAPYAIEKLRAMGWTGQDLLDLRGIDSRDIDVEVKYETYKGKDQMRVEVLTSGRGLVARDRLDAQGMRAFAAKYAAVAKSAPLAPGPVKVSSDDLAF